MKKYFIIIGLAFLSLPSIEAAASRRSLGLGSRLFQLNSLLPKATAPGKQVKQVAQKIELFAATEGRLATGKAPIVRPVNIPVPAPKNTSFVQFPAAATVTPAESDKPFLSSILDLYLSDKTLADILHGATPQTTPATVEHQTDELPAPSMLTLDPEKNPLPQSPEGIGTALEESENSIVSLFNDADNTEELTTLTVPVIPETVVAPTPEEIVELPQAQSSTSTLPAIIITEETAPVAVVETTTAVTTTPSVPAVTELIAQEITDTAIAPVTELIEAPQTTTAVTVTTEPEKTIDFEKVMNFAGATALGAGTTAVLLVKNKKPATTARVAKQVTVVARSTQQAAQQPVTQVKVAQRVAESALQKPVTQQTAPKKLLEGSWKDVTKVDLGKAVKTPHIAAPTAPAPKSTPVTSQQSAKPKATTAKAPVATPAKKAPVKTKVTPAIKKPTPKKPAAVKKEKPVATPQVKKQTVTKKSSAAKTKAQPVVPVAKEAPKAKPTTTSTAAPAPEAKPSLQPAEVKIPEQQPAPTEVKTTVEQPTQTTTHELIVHPEVKAPEPKLNITQKEIDVIKAHDAQVVEQAKLAEQAQKAKVNTPAQPTKPLQITQQTAKNDLILHHTGTKNRPLKINVTPEQIKVIEAQEARLLQQAKLAEQAQKAKVNAPKQPTTPLQITQQATKNELILHHTGTKNRPQKPTITPEQIKVIEAQEARLLQQAKLAEQAQKAKVNAPKQPTKPLQITQQTTKHELILHHTGTKNRTPKITITPEQIKFIEAQEARFAQKPAARPLRTQTAQLAAETPAAKVPKGTTAARKPSAAPRPTAAKTRPTLASFTNNQLGKQASIHATGARLPLGTQAPQQQGARIRIPRHPNLNPKRNRRLPQRPAAPQPAPAAPAEEAKIKEDAEEVIPTEEPKAKNKRSPEEETEGDTDPFTKTINRKKEPVQPEQETETAPVEIPTPPAAPVQANAVTLPQPHPVKLDPPRTGWASKVPVFPTPPAELPVPSTEILDAEAARHRTLELFGNRSNAVVVSKHKHTALACMPEKQATPSHVAQAQQEHAEAPVVQDNATEKELSDQPKNSLRSPVKIEKEPFFKQVVDLTKDVVSMIIIEPLKQLGRIVVEVVKLYLP